MKKAEYIRMLIEDNATAAEPQKEMNAAIIDCVDIALSQMPESFEVKDTSAGLAEFWEMIQKDAYDKILQMPGIFDAQKLKESAAKITGGIQPGGNMQGFGACCSPIRAVELIAERLGAKYERASVRYANKSAVKRLEDFL